MKSSYGRLVCNKILLYIALSHKLEPKQIFLYIMTGSNFRFSTPLGKCNFMK